MQETFLGRRRRAVALGALLACALTGVAAAPALEDLVVVRRMWTVGVESGPREQEFSKIIYAAWDSVGNVYLLDGGANTVRVFSATGRFVRTFSREGRGEGIADCELLLSLRMAPTAISPSIVEASGRSSLPSCSRLHKPPSQWGLSCEADVRPPGRNRVGENGGPHLCRMDRIRAGVGIRAARTGAHHTGELAHEAIPLAGCAWID